MARLRRISGKPVRIAGIAAAVLVLLVVAGPHVVPVLITTGAGYLIGRLHASLRPGGAARPRRSPRSPRSPRGTSAS